MMKISSIHIKVFRNFDDENIISQKLAAAE